MKPIINAEWTKWLSNEKDENRNSKLKEDAPKEIKKQYEEFKMNYQKYKNKFFAEYEEDN